MILHKRNAETQAEYQSDAWSTKDTPYLALTGELWGVFCEYLSENLPSYNGTTLYSVVLLQHEKIAHVLTTDTP